MKRVYLISLLVVVVLGLAAAGLAYYQKQTAFVAMNNTPSILNDIPTPNDKGAKPAKAIAEPIADALSRVTKKPFGIHVTPKDSPVSPERFTGYHTGVDFETLPAEQNIDVPVYAICPGKLLIKEWASGYGGVINESCVINGQAVTVTYGHLKLASVAKKVGQTFTQGEQIGVLGKGYSTETDGERKHLHLGIHKGAAAKLNGYVATKAELAQWINAMDYLK